MKDHKFEPDESDPHSFTPTHWFCKLCGLRKGAHKLELDYDADKAAWNAPGAQWIRLLELRSLIQEIYESDQMIIRIINERINVLENKLKENQEEAMGRDND